MRRSAMLIGVGLLVAATPVGAAGDHELLAAQQELKIAKDHLQAAGPDYGGHRRGAMEAIDQALREIRQGLEFSRSERGEPAPGPKGKTKPTAEPFGGDD